MINIGIAKSSGNISDVGIDDKMSELHTAMGLAVLDDIDEILVRRNHLLIVIKACLMLT